MSVISHGPAPSETRHLGHGDDVHPHRHDDHQLIYASTGVLEVFVADGTWFTPSVRAVWVPAGASHHWQVHGATTVHLVGIGSSLMPSAAQTPRLVTVRPLLRELVIACSRGSREDAGRRAGTAAGHRLLQVLVDQVVDQVETAPGPVTTMVPALRDPRLRAVHTLVENDLSVPWSLGQLGRRVGASERTLSRLFHDELGMGFTVWRNQLRLHRASLLLAQGSSVTHAASSCGFSSPSAFISAFRAAFGRTPGSLYRDRSADAVDSGGALRT
jgi:AraC-like DNA-binding protein